MSKYGVISGPYFPVFSPNTGKYGPEITPYLGTFHAVSHATMDYFDMILSFFSFLYGSIKLLEIWRHSLYAELLFGNSQDD